VFAKVLLEVVFDLSFDPSALREEQRVRLA
jgi:hypothetical protein